MVITYGFARKTRFGSSKAKKRLNLVPDTAPSANMYTVDNTTANSKTVYFCMFRIKDKSRDRLVKNTGARSLLNQKGKSYGHTGWI